VDARQFLGLESTDDARRFRLPVEQSLCTWGGFLFGGAALGAALAAMELATGRPATWATAQYLSFATPPAVLDIEVTVPSSGYRMSQARAIARVDDTEVLTVLGALGSRPDDAAGTWARYPADVPGPDECDAREMRSHHFRGESVMSRFDQRLAKGRSPLGLDGVPGDGSAALWVRLPDDLEVSAGALAVLGDFVPFGIGQALGVGAGGTSLDNTIRIHRLVPTRWVLVDVFVHAVADGFAHGRVHLWAEDRTLLAIASQSALVRYWKD
jgi:acyl-CoA thioesterase-2